MVRDLGLDLEAVATRAGVDPDLLSREAFRVPVETFLRLVEAVEAEAGDPGLALGIAEISHAQFSPFMFAALCSPNLVVAIERIALHKRLVAPMRVDHHLTDAGLEVSWVWDDPTLVSPPLLIKAEFVVLTHIARIGTREPVRLVRATAPLPLEPLDAFTRFLGVTPRVGPKTSVVFSAADAQRPFLTANEALWQSFEPELRRRMDGLKSSLSVAERTRSVLLECLPGGGVELSRVARRLGMSGRTLQRRLGEEGLSFRVLVRTTRERLAVHYLTRTGIPYAEVAFLLGFDEPSSFFRAYRSWTGRTPDQTRRNPTGV